MNREHSRRRQAARGGKGVDRRGATWWDAALLVVPSKWIPPWICIDRSHNWIHTDTDRVDVQPTIHDERKRGTDLSSEKRGAWAPRTWRSSQLCVKRGHEWRDYGLKCETVVFKSVIHWSSRYFDLRERYMI